VDCWNSEADRWYVLVHVTQLIVHDTSSTDTLRTTTPILTKVIFTWLGESYVYYRLTNDAKAAGVIKKPQGIGYGIGLAFALFAMQGPLCLVLSGHVTDAFVSLEVASFVRCLR
jgi:hypothetical protein